jgi:hypothetical protein
MARKIISSAAAIYVALFFVQSVLGYPIDGYPQTGIRRLERLRLIAARQLTGPMPVDGALKSITDIKLNLTGPAGEALNSLPPIDKKLQERIDALFLNRDAGYSLALLDITPGRPARLSLRQADRQFSPGSVGKLAIAAGLFRELKTLYPNDLDRRQELLRSRMVIADRWIHKDHHDIPVYDPDTRTFASRPVRDGDTFSLYEWADHMLSASANAAASIVWKEVILMRAFGPGYPPTREQEQRFFEKTAPAALRDLAVSTVNDPLRAIGIQPKDWFLGSFFTSAGKKIVPGGGESVGTPLGLLRFLVAMEQGYIVDEWSSLEIKRLIYMTTKRIRFASSPALNNAAVYFKSGSLYRCKPEPGFTCGKYRGNVDNYMNSVAIIEQPDGRIYLVALMSNVLHKNSAADHQSLATFIDRILLP